ncbi:hypothetical protein GW17_00029653 [Ensete ventricosum]|nr:hypothetical protein GW17_00029653 [Ensete ventricosum]
MSCDVLEGAAVVLCCPPKVYDGVLRLQHLYSERSRGVGAERRCWRLAAGGWKGRRVTLGRGDRTVEEVEEQPQEKSAIDRRASTRDAMATKRSKRSHSRRLPPGT